MGINLTKLSDIASIRHGYAFEGEFFSTDEKEHILLTPGNFHVDQKLYFGTNTKFYDGPIPEDYVLDNGDLLVVMTDLTKDMAILGNAVVLESPKPVLHNQRIGKIEYHQDKVDKNFLCFVLNSPFVRNKVKATASGTTVRHTSPSKILEVSVWFPPLPEQQKIAKILSTWDKAITTTEKLIATSQQQKKALMQQLLTGKKRLVNPETGRVFEGDWEKMKISQLGSIVSGGTPSTETPSYWNGNIHWVTPTDITKLSTRKIDKTARTITEDGLKNSSAKLVPKGSLLVCTRATIGEMAISEHEMCTNQGFKNLIPNKKANVDFIYYLMCFSKHKLVSKASGSTFLELSKKDFEQLRFKVPEVKEQQKIASVLTAADQEIELLEAKLAHLKYEKKALMQQLLTGKRRVKVDAMEVA